MYEGTQLYAPDQCEQVRYPTVRERLEQQKNELTERLNKIQAAITALDSNPEVANVLEILGKAGF